jgi:hypothetical protein
MCCDDLVCASCSRPVAEARCPVCRAARAERHGAQPLSMAVFLAVLVGLLMLAAFLATRG